jgi:hypothetical protein
MVAYGKVHERKNIEACAGRSGHTDRVNLEAVSMSQCKNVFEAILRYGHDEDFVPQVDEQFVPTDAPAGSSDKIEVLRRRVELGQPLWHTTDRVDYSGLTGAIRPRE